MDFVGRLFQTAQFPTGIDSCFIVRRDNDGVRRLKPELNPLTGEVQFDAVHVGIVIAVRDKPTVIIFIAISRICMVEFMVHVPGLPIKKGFPAGCHRQVGNGRRPELIVVEIVTQVWPGHQAEMLRELILFPVADVDHDDRVHCSKNIALGTGTDRGCEIAVGKECPRLARWQLGMKGRSVSRAIHKGIAAIRLPNESVAKKAFVPRDEKWRSVVVGREESCASRGREQGDFIHPKGTVISSEANRINPEAVIAGRTEIMKFSRMEGLIILSVKGDRKQEQKRC